MNKDSFDKIINNDKEDISSKDFTKAIEYFLSVKDNNSKKQFLNNFKPLINYYFTKSSLVFEIDHDVYTINNNIAYKIGQLSFYMYSLYGKTNLEKIKKEENIDYYKGYKTFFDKYYFISKVFQNEVPLIKRLKTYRKEKDISEKYQDFNIDILKEAYYTVFTIDNYSDKDNYYKRIDSFLEKYNINIDTFKEYIRAYGLLYLNTDLKHIDNKILSIVLALKKINITGSKEVLAKVLEKNKDSNDNENFENIVFSKHISLDVLDYLYENKYFDTDTYNKLYVKVSKAIESLSEKYKYIHYSIVMSKLEKEEDLNIIDNIVENNNNLIHPEYIRKFLNNYRQTLTEEEKENLKEQITTKIDEARKRINYKKMIKRRQSDVENTKEILKNIDFTLFLDNSIRSIKQFCQLVGITERTYYKCIKILEEVNNPLYLQIKEKIEKHNKKNKEINKSTENIISIVKQIEFGIIDKDDNIRPFELLDYFLNTKLNYSEFFDIYINSNNCSKSSLTAFKNFMVNNKISYVIADNKMDKITVDQELNGTTILMIDNEPYEVTREEKEEVINFLQEKEIPLYIKVYKQALRRHINGNLILEDEKKLIKKG